MKKIFLFLFILPSVLLAAPVDPNLAQQVAENFINAPTKDANGVLRAPKKPKRMVKVTKQVTDTQQYYVFNNENGEGFVIVAADDVARPILGYSQTSTMDVDNMPDNLRWWLSEYDREIRWAQENNLKQPEETAEEWNSLFKAEQLIAATPVVEPLIKTNWDQRAPYNNYCPIFNGSERAATGCVATAVAQIMNYWQHPLKGNGSHSYTSRTRSYQLSADFENTTYDWKNMADTYSYYDSQMNYCQYSRTTTQKNAVATLMSHVGIAFEMNYAANDNGESGSDNRKAYEVMPTYFGYDKSIFYLTKDDHTIISWIGVLGNQLDQKRPVLYQGTNTDPDPQKISGHSFVCDGYNSDLYFHINWGWSGLADGYYNLWYLIPTNSGTGAGMGDYTYNQVAVINIMPERSEEVANNLQLVADISIIKGEDIIDPSLQRINTFDTLSVDVYIANIFCTNDFTGTLYAVMNANENYLIIDSIKNVTIPATNSIDDLPNNIRHFTFKHNGNYYVPDGTYSIQIYYQAENGNDFIPVGSDYYGNALFFDTQYNFYPRRGKYVVVSQREGANDNNWYYMSSDLGSSGTKRFQAINTNTKNLGEIPVLGVDEKLVWELESNEDKWKLKNKSQYVSWISGNSARSDNTGVYLTIDANENKVQVHFNDGTDDRYLSLNKNTGNDYFAFYSGKGQIPNLVFLPYPYKEEEITITAKMPDDWGSDISAWVWDEDSEGRWEILKHENNRYSFTSSKAFNIIFVNGASWNGDNNQTVNIPVSNSTCITIGNEQSGKRSYAITDCSEEIIIKAKMPTDWGNTIVAWTWENGSEGNWTTLKKEGDWYSYSTTALPLNIIFVNGTTWNGDNNQSVDITLAESSCIQLFENTSGKRNYEIVECEEPETENYVVLAQRNAASNWFYMTSDLGTASTKRYQAVDAGTTNLKEVNTENLESKYYWQLEENKLHTAAGYSTWKSGNSANLDGVGKELSIEQQDDEKYIFSFMDGEDTRRLALNKAAGNDYFAYYKGTDQIYKLTLLKEGENGSATSIESIFKNESSVATKLLRNGQILILRGEKVYTVTGQEVK